MSNKSESETPTIAGAIAEIELRNGVVRHTRGPWNVSSSVIVVADANEQFKIICSTTTFSRVTPYPLAECCANARLIAAAPELRSELSLLIRTVNDTLRHGLTDAQRECLEEVVLSGNQAISKADGRTNDELRYRRH